MKRWLKRLAALFAAALALWFGLQAGQHRKKQEKREREVAELGADKTASVGQAKAAREKAKAEKHKAHAALAEGRAQIEQIKETTDADFAARIDRLNRRLRGD